MKYSEFIKSKEVKIKKKGFDPIDIHPVLFDFQNAITKWAIKKGRSAVWAGTGLGKSFIQIVWSHNVSQHTGGAVLILAPMAIPAQTKKEGAKLGLEINICQSQTDVVPGINITNYEKLHKFDPSAFVGVVLEESSILKNFAGATKQQLIESFKDTDYKLCCSATPSPNDFTEYGNHAEFLNICTRSEMLATYFVHDSGATQKWRLKGHAETAFFKWVSEWAIMIERPSDIGFDDKKMTLPPLNIYEHIVPAIPADGELFVVPASTLNERRKARRDSLEARCQLAAELNNKSDEIWLNWCDLNDESLRLTELIKDAIEVKGTDKNDVKESRLLGFANGEIKSLVTKPKIAQFGLNWQVCHNMCFVGLSDSFEAMYQAIRRCYRFGQTHPVNVHIIISEREGNVLQNIKTKEANAKAMLNKMVRHISINTIEHIKSDKPRESVNGQKFQTPKFMRNYRRAS